MKHPTFSLVIPCYNEERYVGFLLSRVCQQSLQPGEVIIADSYSTDNTVNEALKFSDRLPIKIAYSTIRTPGAARNAGAKLATMDYIVFMDADCLPVGRRFLERVQLSLATKPVDFITPMFTSDGWHPLDYLFFWVTNFLLLTGIGFRDRVPCIGGTMCVKRTLHDQIDGFNPDLLLEDDLDYGRRLHNAEAARSPMPFLYTVVSSRRSKKEGRINALLHSTPVDSWIGKRVHQHLKTTGRGKKYGEF